MTQSHFRFGYLVQVSSILTLMLANVALPNVLGAEKFARLNESYALVGFSCLIFSDGVSLLLVNALAKSSQGGQARMALVARGIFEHVLLATLGVVLLYGIVNVLAPDHRYGLGDWGIIALTNAIIATYVVVVAVLTAGLSNHRVAVLAIAQGLGSVIFPLGLVALGLDVSWSIAASHLPGVLVLTYWLTTGAASGWTRGILPYKRLCLVPALFSSSAQTAMRLVLTWMPVLLLAAQNEIGDAGAYKIALSLALGVCALVPYHKQTMLSLLRTSSVDAAARGAAGAIGISAIGGVCMVWLSPWLVPFLFPGEFDRVADFMLLLAPFVVLQVFSDVLLVGFVAAGKSRELVIGCLVAVFVALVTTGFAKWLAWVPLITMAAFSVSVLGLARQQLGLALPARTALIGVLPGLIAASVPSDYASALATLVLFLWFLVDHIVRESVVRLVFRLVRGFIPASGGGSS